MLLGLKKQKITQSNMILVISAVFTCGYNIIFFQEVLKIYSITSHPYQIISIFIILFATINIFLNIVINKYTLKPVLVVLFIIASLASYTMSQFSVVVDINMIDNILNTNIREARDYLNPMLFVYFFLFGIFPSILVIMIPIRHNSFKAEMLSKFKMVIGSLILVIVLLLSSSRFFASFLREHKPLRFYSNPTYSIYSSGKYIGRLFRVKNTKLEIIGRDAVLPKNSLVDRELVIVVIGESLRADHLSLNGYKKQTNPWLKNEDIISFMNMTACGTSTSISVPCMFSKYRRKQFSEKKAKETENLIDVLGFAGVNVLWRDNNSDSKGVAVRAAYEDFMNSNNNPVCDVECRDIGMLTGLHDYINSKKSGDILIVLHQMGNHGPAYFRRYPSDFEKFKPTCKTNELTMCTNEEIINTYDNVVLYTDYFLSKVIGLLKDYSNSFETAMIYVSDHGESLGENGIYLHALPYFMAPKEQTNVAAVFWFGQRIQAELDMHKLRKSASRNFSHDHFFHTMLGLFEVTTSVYDKELDMLYGIKKKE